MSLFRLDPSSLAERAAGTKPPSLTRSLLRGVVGFTIVSLAGFVPWAFFGGWFRGRGGEAAMYAACALVFILLSGLLLHRLILGRDSLRRFYQLFTLAFTVYSVAWIAGWMSLRGHPGSVVGLLAGTTLMGWILAAAFDAREQTFKVIAALFLLNSLGYFIGGVVEQALLKAPEISIFGSQLAPRPQRLLAMMSWGLFYGIGLGAGLGLAFHFCQTKARRLLAEAARP